MQKIYNRFLVSNSESWNCFNQLRDSWRSKGKLLEELSNYLKEKAELDKSYARGLEKLSKMHVFENLSGSFGAALKSLQITLSELSVNLLIHSQFMDSELCLNIKNLLNSGELAIKDIREKTKNLIIEREQYLKKNDNLKNKYLKSAKGEGSAISSVINYFQRQSDYETDYLVANEKLNMFNGIFKTEIEEDLNNFRKFFFERVNSAKSNLEMLVSSEANWVYQTKMHLDKLARTVVDIMVNEDQEYIESFIYEFINIGNQDCVVKENEIFDNLKNIIFGCWRGIEVNNENFEYFKESMKKLGNRKLFVKVLNEKRELGEFLLPDKTFSQLGELFKIVLDVLITQKDFKCARQCIILSQTFNNCEKIYIQSFIVNHPLWDSQNYWPSFLENSIDLEICKTNVGLDNEESLEEFNNRIKTVVVSTLASYIHIMVCFKRDSQDIFQAVEKCKVKFSVSEDDFNINSIINLCTEI